MTNQPVQPGFTIRAMRPDEANQVAELIFQSTNHWYETSGYAAVFKGKWNDCRLFTDVYEDLDPGCCLIALSGQNFILGSCFYHPRESHVSLGIMNTHPAFGRKGVAKALLLAVMEKSEALGLPLRLVSSAFNLDSFSLYTRQGMAPYALFQDLILPVPKSGVAVQPVADTDFRDATLEDVDAIVSLEETIWATSRKKDWHYFIRNNRGVWHVTVAENSDGKLTGVLASVLHSGRNMLGPGVALSTDIATGLIQSELNKHKGSSPVFLIPANEPELVEQVYAMGARNCELHVGQCLGEAPEIEGIVMPTFMPETA